ncbi:MAG: HigA family addiction module antidote protein [Firmicutes bacterium]|nr:HigA family addiction module antidote protein [Bacillota bacterium]
MHRAAASSRHSQRKAGRRITTRHSDILPITKPRIQDILHGRRKITADTSIRLGKYFGVSDAYFLNIQNDIDLRNTRLQIAEELARIPSAAL